MVDWAVEGEKLALEMSLQVLQRRCFESRESETLESAKLTLSSLVATEPSKSRAPVFLKLYTGRRRDVTL